MKIRKLISIFLCVSMISAFSSISSSAEEIINETEQITEENIESDFVEVQNTSTGTLLGDVDGNGKINSVDAIKILQDYSKKLAGQGSTLNNDSADINGDSKIDSKDAVFDLKYYAFSIVETNPGTIQNFVKYTSAKQNVSLTTNNYKFNVSWQSIGADEYKISLYTPNGNYVYGIETESGTSQTYEMYMLSEYMYSYPKESVYGFRIGVSSVVNGITYPATLSETLFNEDYAIERSSPYLETIANAPKTNTSKSYTAREYDSNGNITSQRKVTVSSKEQNFINQFLKQNGLASAPDWQKIYTVLYWIHYNVDYDYDYDISLKHTYADAIFNYRQGQCLQYNGTLCEMMACMGYDVYLDHIPGHFTTDIYINGVEYNIETGNYGKNGEWGGFYSYSDESL